MKLETPHPVRDPRRLLTGFAAVLFAALYVTSDLMELAAGELYPAQLWVTYRAEAGVPFFMLGLDAYQQPAGLLGLLGATAYGASFVGLSATVLYPFKCCLDYICIWKMSAVRTCLPEVSCRAAA